MKQYQTDDIKELAAAMVAAQAAIAPALKDSNNPHFKSRYADMTAVVEASRKPLTDNGLAVFQIVDYSESDVFVMTQLTHSSGQWVRSWYPVRPIKPDPQALGSAITYAKRYAYCALVGVVADDDDDGNKASERPEKTKSIFETSELRDTYVENCIAAIFATKTGAEFKDQKDLNAAKWNALKSATDQGDKDAWAKIAEAYNTKYAELKAAAEKPKTVTQAKKADVLPNDEIPYAWVVGLIGAGLTFLQMGGVA